MKARQRFVVSLSIAFLSLASASAQILEGQASIWWEASADNGATWGRQYIEVDSSQSTLLVRQRVEFDAVPGRHFGGIAFDGRVTSVAGAGLADSASNFLRYPGSNFIPVAASRFGSVLKIDDFEDFEAPGQGRFWIGVVQTPGPPYQTISPYRTFTYDLQLDGSLGTRIVDGVFRENPALPLNRWVLIRVNFSEDLYFPLCTQYPITINVVPAPSAGMTMAMIAACASRRRR